MLSNTYKKRNSSHSKHSASELQGPNS